MYIKTILLLFAFFLCTPFETRAEIKCATSTGEEWSCAGVIEFKAVKPTGRLYFRRVIFKNGDILNEIEVKEENKSFKQLIIQPSNLELTRGDEGLTAFVFLIPTLTIEALKSAYPSGPDSVPEGVSVKTATVKEIKDKDKNELELTVITDRINRHQIKYSSKISIEGDVEITGLWDDHLTEPLPNEYNLNEWNHSATVQLKNLFDARSLRPEHK